MLKLRILLLAFSSLLASLNANAVSYTYTDLELAIGRQFFAAAINNKNQIAGSISLGTPRKPLEHAALWSNGTLIDLEPAQKVFSYAQDINDLGQVVGRSYDVLHGPAVMFKDGNVIDLNKPSLRESWANSINNHGVVVGDTLDDNSDSHATKWDGNTVIDLGTLGGKNSQAKDINDAGTIVGGARTSNNAEFHATIWSNGSIVDLGTLGGKVSGAEAINEGEVIVGYSTLNDDYLNFHATLWENGNIKDLGSLGGNSNAFDINNAGQIVGYSILEGYVFHATLWDGSKIIDLNSYLDASTIAAGWVLRSADRINDNGWIIGTVENYQLGLIHSYVLSVSTVPEPESYAMLLAGIGLVGLFARRKLKITSLHNDISQL